MLRFAIVLLAWSALLQPAAAETEEECLAKIIYWEARNQPLLGRQMVAYVAAERAKANLEVRWGGSSLCAVMRHEWRRPDGKLVNEFTPFGSKERKLPKDAAGLRARAVARQVKGEWFTPPPELVHATFFVNVEIAGEGGSCYFSNYLWRQGSVEDHAFYRYPGTGDEFRVLAARFAPCFASEDFEVARLPRPRPKVDNQKQAALAN
jgi:hypothetical protein